MRIHIIDKEYYKRTKIKAGSYANFPSGETFVTPESIYGMMVGDVVINIDRSYVIPDKTPIVVEFKGNRYNVIKAPKRLKEVMIKERGDARQRLNDIEKSGSLPKEVVDIYKKNTSDSDGVSFPIAYQLIMNNHAPKVSNEEGVYVFNLSKIKTIEEVLELFWDMVEMDWIRVNAIFYDEYLNIILQGSSTYDDLSAIADEDAKAFLSEENIYQYLSKDDLVLDVGTGCGAHIARFIANKVKKVYGTEISPKNIKQAKKHIQEESITNIELRLVKDTRLPYKAKFFDRVIISRVFFSLIPEMRIRMLNSVSRVIKRKGTLNIRTYFNDRLCWGIAEWEEYLLKSGFEVCQNSIRGNKEEDSIVIAVKKCRDARVIASSPLGGSEKRPLSLFSQEDIQKLISRVLPKLQNQNSNIYNLVTLPYLPGAYMGVRPEGQPEHDGNRNFRRNLTEKEFELYDRQRSMPFSKDVLDEYVKQCFKVMESVLDITLNKNTIAEQITTIQSNMLVIEIVRLFARKFIADRNVDIFNSHRDKNIITNNIAMLLLRDNYWDLKQKLLRALASYVIKYFLLDEIYSRDVNKLKEKCNRKLAEEISGKKLQVDNFGDFLSRISGNTRSVAAVLFDDNCEVVFYLDIIMDLLKKYNQPRFILIPRAKNYVNDVSYNDISRFLRWEYFSTKSSWLIEPSASFSKSVFISVATVEIEARRLSSHSFDTILFDTRLFRIILAIKASLASLENWTVPSFLQSSRRSFASDMIFIGEGVSFFCWSAILSLFFFRENPSSMSALMDCGLASTRLFVREIRDCLRLSVSCFEKPFFRSSSARAL